MSKSDALVCPSCGALNSADAEQCELCGTPLPASAEEARPSEVPPVAESTPGVATGGVFCNQCGWKNPAGARFCSRCGTQLQEGAAAPSPASRPGPRPPAPEPAAGATGAGEEGSVKRQVGLLVGISVVLIVALFLVTLVSKDLSGPPPASIPASEEQAPPDDMVDNTPIPAAVAEEVAVLEQEIEAATGEARVEKQQELVNLLIGVGRYGQAAGVQTNIAEAVGSAEAWSRAGDLYYDWMGSLQDAQKRAAADRAVQAYQRALDLDPDNLDIRTDMATAYLNSSSPMQGVEEVKRVLDEDPDHVQARFNYGIMLTMINRPEQAIEQFEAVQRIVGEDSPYYRQAAQAIADVRQSMGS